MLKVILALLFLGVAVNAKVTRPQITAIVNSLNAAVQLDNKCKTSADCAAAAVGARACGGPNSYVVYSRKSSNADDIISLAKLSTELEQKYNMENSVMSICMMAIPPSAVCTENKCTASSSFSPLQPIDLQ
ncbi:hypothetical protein I4U23_021068 [Adineta vaga]|nr:hypothetical protein I4U23_021068 [Adineta vaga]